MGYLPNIRKELKEFFKFGIIGLIGTLLNLIFLFLFTEKIGFYYLISAIFAFVIAMTNNFILNKIWTFKEKISENFIKKYFQFFLVSLTALFANLILLYTFTELIGIYYIYSQVIAILLTLMINFLGNKKWTFKK